jgi:hypothetical protein
MGIAAVAVVAAPLVVVSTANAAPAPWAIGYSAHIQDYGWQPWQFDGAVAGDAQQGVTGKRMEALEVSLDPAVLPAGAHVCYQAHVQNVGWQGQVCDGQLAGTTGQSLRMEAVSIQLINAPGWSICYAAEVAGSGWQVPECNGGQAGTTGLSTPMYNLRIWLLPNTYAVVAQANSGEFSSGGVHQRTTVVVGEIKQIGSNQTLMDTYRQTTSTWNDNLFWGGQATIVASLPANNAVTCLTYNVGSVVFGGASSSRTDVDLTTIPFATANQFVTSSGKAMVFDDSLTGGGQCIAQITQA